MHLKIIKYRLKEVQYIDALSYSDKFSKEDFFIRKPINHEKINFHNKMKISNFIANDSNKYLFNSLEDDFEGKI